MFWRCLHGVLCDLLMFVAYEYTSYGKAFSLFLTGTLIAPILAQWMLGEKLQIFDIVGIILGFIGTLCLMKPWIPVESVELTTE